MSPKSLSTGQKENQKRMILEKGKAPILQCGIKKVSVDDIVKAAGIAKGTFYLYFQSKEDFMAQLIADISGNYFALAERIVLQGGGGLRENIRQFFHTIFDLPEILFFFREHQEIDAFTRRLHDSGFADGEQAAFGGLLRLAGIDTEKVIPDVVHNYIHAVYAAKVMEWMIAEYRQTTVDLLIDGLVNYIFAGFTEA